MPLPLRQTIFRLPSRCHSILWNFVVHLISRNICASFLQILLRWSCAANDADLTHLWNLMLSSSNGWQLVAGSWNTAVAAVICDITTRFLGSEFLFGEGRRFHDHSSGANNHEQRPNSASAVPSRPIFHLNHCSCLYNFSHSEIFHHSVPLSLVIP